MMRFPRKLLCTTLVVLLLAAMAAAADSGYLYRATLVQAAPGSLLELIDLYKAAAARTPEGEESPLWMRHSQGDHWDLLVLQPMGSYAEYYAPGRIARRQRAEASTPNTERLKQLIATQEDVFAYGPPLADLRAAFANASFFHVEMFQALPGRHADLYNERRMENAYLKQLKRPENFIFVRDEGAAWDVFTIGAYTGLKHFAESADIPEKDEDAAARAAGFKAANQIGPYLRNFIRAHHDTLAVAIK